MQDAAKKDDFDERVAKYLADINRQEAGIVEQKTDALPEIAQAVKNEQEFNQRPQIPTFRKIPNYMKLNQNAASRFKQPLPGQQHGNERADKPKD